MNKLAQLNLTPALELKRVKVLRLQALLLVGTLLTPLQLMAEVESTLAPATLSLFVENDYPNDTDRYYTSGLRLAYLSAELTDSDLWAPLQSLNHFLNDRSATAHWGISLTHQFFTPNIRTDPNPQLDDRPFAGWLALGFSFHSKTTTHLDSLEFNLGVLGPASGAQDLQNFIHDAIGDIRVQGWDNQLQNEPTFDLTYRRQWLWDGNFGGSAFGWSGYGNAGFSFGTTRVSANAGAGFRLGYNASQSYSNERISPVSYDISRIANPSLAWYLFAEIRGDAIAFNSFLDGGFFRDGQSIDKEPFVGEVATGVALENAQWSFTIANVFRSDEFRGQEFSFNFTSARLSYRF